MTNGSRLLPMSGITVLDFSTLLPGPLCTRMLAAAGAKVIKIERPGGEDMRHNGTPVDGVSAHYRMLNEGKKVIEIDLRTADGLATVREHLAGADVLVEQFRPGVMKRLGLGYEEVTPINPRLVYCSITGYGQTAPEAATAGHDLNYLASAGVLALTDPPALPAALIADIGGGTWPAVMNILLALRQRDHTGRGSHLDIAMRDNLFSFASWAWAECAATGATPAVRGVLNGGSPRYQVYRAACGGYLACAPLEQKFWENFCDAIELESPHRDDGVDPDATIDAVLRIIQTRSAEAWMVRFAGRDVCVSQVVPMDDAMRRRQARQTPTSSAHDTMSLPLPIAGTLVPGVGGVD